eukprot:XP_014007590.1 PREDICTED: uncharacterized protein LOC106575549 isoform X2 [Salmo salar]
MYEMSAFLDDLSLKVGGELVLKPDKSTVTDPITSIAWKHGKNKVAEWDKDFGGLDIYAAFKNRTTLDQTTGELRISGLMKTDSGVYSVEFNSKLPDKTYKLSVFKAVPKPTITSSCNTNKTSCTLTCEGDTTDAEPVTYRWKEGEGAWEVVGKQLTVSKSDTGKSNNGYNYTCKMKNAVSEEVSEVFGEVFGPERSNTGAVVGGVVVTIVVLVAVITGFLVWKKQTGMAVNNTNRVKSVTKLEEGGSDESKMDGSAGPEGKDETKTDCSAGPGGEDETKMDCSAGPGSDDETKTDGTAAPGSDLNAAENEEANGERSVLLNEDTVKYNNGEGAAEENSAL